MFSAPTRLLHTEGFRVCAIFVAVFALAMAVLASSVLFIVNEEFRDQIVQPNRGGTWFQ